MDYDAVSGFLPVGPAQPLNVNSFFCGAMDGDPLLREYPAFDSFMEARQALEKDHKSYRYVVELFHSKEHLPEMLESGISNSTVKIIDYSEAL